MWGANGSPTDAVTWVGLLSGGLPVAAVLLVAVWFLVKREETREASRSARELELLATIERLHEERFRERDALQEERLKERDTLLREILPVMKENGEALVRASVIWDRSANQAGR